MADNEVKEATVHPDRGISPVWLVPLAALIAAAWLGFQSWRDRGVEIVINFDSAPGIVVNKTELRFKDVRVGVVRNVQLSTDLSRVRVVAEVVPDIAARLSSNSQFWVVSPQISASGISGLSTLLGGVYIGVDPGEPGDDLDEYEGALTAVSVQSEASGKRIRLRADNLGSLGLGAPIYYRQVPAGEVLGYELSERGDYVVVDAFVRAPYDQYVYRQSRFWNVSGFGVEVSDRGIKARMSSLASLVAGGIAYDTPEGLRDPEPAEENQLFLLYPDAQAVDDGVYTVRYYYQLHFQGSVRGLNVGAAVEFRGIPVGEVVSIRFAGVEQDSRAIRVLIAFEPQRLGVGRELGYEELAQEIEAMVAQGLKAQLKVGNLLTGAMFVDLIFEPDTPGELVQRTGEYPQLPTAAASYEEISRQMTDLLGKINAFPIEELGSELVTSLRQLRGLLSDIEQQQVTAKLGSTLTNLESGSAQLQVTLEQAGAAMTQLEQTLATLENSVAADAPMIYEVEQMTREVTAAATAFRRLSEQLNRQPDALIFGRGDN